MLTGESLDGKDPYASALYQLDCMSSPSIVVMGHPEGGPFYIRQPNMGAVLFLFRICRKSWEEGFYGCKGSRGYCEGWRRLFFLGKDRKKKKKGFSTRVKGGEDFLGSNLLG